MTEDLHSTFRIGDFARLGGVTTKALRHYDRIGVLRPAVVDPHSRYRRYSAGQLVDLYDLLSFARLGLSLRQSRDIMEHESVGDSLLRALLAAKREIEARVAQDTARLTWLTSKLDDLRSTADALAGSWYSTSAVVLKEQPSLRVMAVRDRLGAYGDADALLDDLSGDASPVAGLGRLRGTVWHDCGVETGVIDCEAVVLAETRPRQRGRTRGHGGRVVDLPAATLACVIHSGGDEGVRSTYAAARRWIADHGLAVVGPNREWYLSGARGEALMEVQFPVGPRRQ